MPPLLFTDRPAVRVGLLGFGCVGQGFYDLVQRLPGAGLAVARIAVKNPGKPRPLPAALFEYDANALVLDDSLEVLVEVIDHADEAFALVAAALRRGRRVATANKAMLAQHLPELLDLEKQYGGRLLYEAAVAGSIPVLRTLDGHFGQEPFRAVRGILNGSSNYVLSRMAADGLDYPTALREAQAAGFAETDPSLDMAAFDPRSKAVLLAAHAFGLLLKPAQILNLGIEHIAPADLEFAAARNQKIKVVADIRRQPDGTLSAVVTPQFVPLDSPLYGVERELNGIEAEAEFAGLQFWQGRGAGGHPTGSAVLADVLALARGKGYNYVKLRQAASPHFTSNGEVKIYLRHADPKTLAQTARELGLEVAGSFASGLVSLARLHEMRNVLRTAGAFVARWGEVQPAAQHRQATTRPILAATV